MPLSHKTHPLITGTLLLTAAGLLSRVLGFFYRIFLSRTIGAEGLGIYQMIFPVYGIFFSLCAGSIQTAISRFTAADPDHAKRTLLSGFSLSFAMSLAAAFVIRHFSGPLAEHVLMEPRCPVACTRAGERDRFVVVGRPIERSQLQGLHRRVPPRLGLPIHGRLPT